MTGSLTLSACALIPPLVQRRTPGQVRLTRAARMTTTGERDNGPLSGLPRRGSCRAPGAAAGTSLPWLHASSGGEYWHTGETERPLCVGRTAMSVGSKRCHIGGYVREWGCRFDRRPLRAPGEFMRGEQLRTAGLVAEDPVHDLGIAGNDLMAVRQLGRSGLIAAGQQRDRLDQHAVSRHQRRERMRNSRGITRCLAPQPWLSRGTAAAHRGHPHEHGQLLVIEPGLASRAPNAPTRATT